MTTQELIKELEEEMLKYLSIPKEMSININATSLDAKSYVNISKWSEESYKNLTPYKKDILFTNTLIDGSEWWPEKNGIRQHSSQMDTTYVFNVIISTFQKLKSSSPMYKNTRVKGKRVLQIFLEIWAKREDITINQWVKIKYILGVVKTWN